MLEHIVTEIIMLRTVTNRGSSAVPTAPRVALRARRPTPRDLIAVHCAGAARLARRRRALDRTSSGSGLSPPASRTPALRRGPRSTLTPLGCYCLGAQILPAGSPRRLAFALPVRGALRCHFWLRILNHFWFRIVNQFWQTFSTASKKPLPFLVRKS